MTQVNSHIGAYEAKTHFSELLSRVEAGEEVIITRHGMPVAKMAPIQGTSTPEQRRAAWDAWDKRAAGLSLGGLRIKDLIEEGRR